MRNDRKINQSIKIDKLGIWDSINSFVCLIQNNINANIKYSIGVHDRIYITATIGFKYGEQTSQSMTLPCKNTVQIVNANPCSMRSYTKTRFQRYAKIFFLRHGRRHLFRKSMKILTVILTLHRLWMVQPSHWWLLPKASCWHLLADA